MFKEEDRKSPLLVLSTSEKKVWVQSCFGGFLTAAFGNYTSEGGEPFPLLSFPPLFVLACYACHCIKREREERREASEEKKREGGGAVYLSHTLSPSVSLSFKPLAWLLFYRGGEGGRKGDEHEQRREGSRDLSDPLPDRLCYS